MTRTEDGEASLFLDFGTNFKAESMFFDEFLGPRNIFGFWDLLCLDILPALRGLYRLDLEYPGTWDRYCSYPLYRETAVEGGLLSHAHFDHYGCISYLQEDIPVFSSLTTALVCKALQDTGGETDSRTYVTPRRGS